MGNSVNPPLGMLTLPSPLSRLAMIAVQTSAAVPDPLSVPANAPEHCPVSIMSSARPINSHASAGNGIAVSRQGRRLRRVCKPGRMCLRSNSRPRPCSTSHNKSNGKREEKDPDPLRKGWCREVYLHRPTWMGICGRRRHAGELTSRSISYHTLNDRSPDWRHGRRHMWAFNTHNSRHCF